MHANTISPTDLSILKDDLAQATVTIRYRKDGELRTETVSRIAVPEKVELFDSCYLVATCKECNSGVSVSEKIRAIIPLADIVEIDVETYEYPDDTSAYEMVPWSHWRKNRHSLLKRLSLE